MIRSKLTLYIGIVLGGMILLWAILRVGNAMERSPFIGGQWQPATEGDSLTIEQSGRYLQVTTPVGKEISAKLEPAGGSYRITYAEVGEVALPALLRRTAQGDLTLVGEDAFEQVWNRPPAPATTDDADPETADGS